VSLSRYEEEGQRLHPRVILTQSVTQTKKVPLHPAESIRIGSGPAQEDTFSSALKKCAPLAVGDWYIYIELGEDLIEYGLIRSGRSVLDKVPDHAFRDQQLDGIQDPAIILRQIADGAVEATTTTGYSVNVTFTGRQLDQTDRRPKLSNLYNVITLRCQTDIAELTQRFLDRAFAILIEKGHGGLVLVLDPPNYTPRQELRDGTWLDPPIDLVARIEQEMSTPDAEATTATRALIDIVAGMLMSDGITVFTTEGKLLGFNVFAKAVTPEQVALSTHSSGGARRRAFQLLTSLLGDDVRACLMLSQDGAMHFAQKDISR
jgi:hypothetical protein